MRSVATLASLALATAPVLVAGKGTLGFSLGTKKADGSCKFQSDYEDDFDAIDSAAGSKMVRGYAASDCNFAKEILPAAKSKGFQVILGIWPDVEESYNADKEAIQTYAPKYEDQVYAITVGSETLYRGSFTGDTLVEKVKDIKSIMPNTKVGTADSWNKIADGTGDALFKDGGVDIMLVNAFAFWQGSNVGAGAEHTYYDDIQQALGHIQKISGSMDKIEFWNGETGWPTDGGSDYENAKAGTKNAEEFYSKAVCSMLDWGVNVFYFEAFDEPWKPVSKGDNGNTAVETKWGAMNADRSTKFSLKC